MTGFSYQTDLKGKPVAAEDVEYTRTSADAAEQVYNVLTQLSQIFPEISQNSL